MRRNSSRIDYNPGRKALTLIELMVVVAVLLFLVAMFFPEIHRARPRAQRIRCVSNLKQIGLGFRTWALDHNGDYPMRVAATNGGTMEVTDTGPTYLHLQTMSNELSTPVILLCPTDSRKKVATNFLPDLNNSKISYFVSVTANETNPQMFLSGDRNITNGATVKNGFLDLTTNRPAGWDHQMHNLEGNVGLADGSVQQFSGSRMRQALNWTGDATNRLSMP
jgi:competence protein ComGC